MGNNELGSVMRLQKNRLSMIIEELLLSFREGSNIHDSVRFYPHSIQRGHMGNRRDDQYTGIFEADKPAIKKMVNRGSQQKSVLAVEPFLMRDKADYDLRDRVAEWPHAPNRTNHYAGLAAVR